MLRKFSDERGLANLTLKELIDWYCEVLAEIDSATPWGKLHKMVEPLYPKVSRAGRPPIRLARMLRTYVTQQCFGLSEEGGENAIHDRLAVRAFVGIDLGRESAPDAAKAAQVWGQSNKIAIHHLSRRRDTK